MEGVDPAGKVVDVYTDCVREAKFKATDVSGPVWAPTRPLIVNVLAEDVTAAIPTETEVAGAVQLVVLVTVNDEAGIELGLVLMTPF